MLRRTLLAAPLVFAVPARLHAMAGHPFSELRLGAPRPEVAASALARRTAIPTRAVRLSGKALLDALDAGHLEAALLDEATLAAASRRMGPRLTLLAAPLVTRTALPAALKADIAAALTPLLATGH